MSQRTERAATANENEEHLEHLGHPRGTLAIVIVYALVFAVGWIVLYVFEFLPRGGPQP